MMKEFKLQTIKNNFLQTNIINKNSIFINKEADLKIEKNKKFDTILSNKLDFDSMNKLEQIKTLNEENHHLKEMLFLEIKDHISSNEEDLDFPNIKSKSLLISGSLKDFIFLI